MEEIKKEAERIINLYLPLVRQSDLHDTYKNKAKQCALICIDEKMRELSFDSTIFESYRDYNYIDSRYEFWQQVKQYIIDNY